MKIFKAISQKPVLITSQACLCIFISVLTLYFYIDKQNELTELRREIPSLTKELKEIQEENHRLGYEIDKFESPEHLMELLRKPEYSHLKFPYINEVIILPENPPLSSFEQG